MLTGRKDTDLIILSNLNDKDLLSVCLTNKYANSLCKSEDFWRNRFIAKWGREDMKFNIDKTWKRFYLLLTKYLNYSEDWNERMYYAAKEGNRDLVELFINKGANNLYLGMNNAIEGGHRDLVELFIRKGFKAWNEGMYWAAREGNKNLVNFFIDKGAYDWILWDKGMKYAAQGGHRKLVEFFY